MYFFCCVEKQLMINLYLILWGLSGLESAFRSRGRGSGSGKSCTEAVVTCKATTSGEVFVGSSDKGGLTSTGKGGRAASTGRTSKPCAPSFTGTFPDILIRMTRIPFLSKRCVTVKETLGAVEDSVCIAIQLLSG